jgi:LPS-assembly lipoprotein
MRKFQLIVLILLNITACGFQLRGTESYNIETVYIRSDYSIAQMLKQQLELHNIQLVPTAKQADVILELDKQRLDRRILTISAISGRLEEVELNLQLEVSLYNPDEELIINQTINYIRDYSYDSNSVLAMGEEEGMLRQELMQEAVAHILRILQSLPES